MKIYKSYVDRQMQSYLIKSHHEILSDGIYELCLHNSNKIGQSLREEQWMLESVADVVGNIQSRLGILDDIDENISQIVE